MRILMISEDFLPYIGGIGHHVVELSLALARRGHEVHLLVRIPHWYKSTAVELAGVKTCLVPTYTFESGRLHKLRHIEFLLKGFKSMRRLMRHNEFDIVHWHGLWSDNILAASARLNSRAKLVFTNHSSKFLEIYSKRLRLNTLKVLMTKPDVCIAPSKELAEKYQLIFKNVRAVFISNGVDLKSFGNHLNKTQARKDLGLPDKGLIVACPRRLCEKNGIQYLLRAITYIPEYQRPLFVIAGDGPMAHELKALAESLGITKHLCFKGAVPYKQMPAIYAASDIAVIPSLMEATSLAALEAMASGLPVVASAVGGLKDLLEESDAGVLVPAANPTLLAEAFMPLITDAAVRERMTISAKKLAAKYSWDQVACRTEEVYKHL